MPSLKRSRMILVIVLMAGLGFWVSDQSNRGMFRSGAAESLERAEEDLDPEAESETDGGQQESRDDSGQVVVETIFVYVAGAVHRPDVYQLPKGSRVYEAIEAAGGLLPDAVPEQLNLAAPLQDGQKVWVPDQDDPMQATNGGSSPLRFDLNTATIDELQQIPGIGPKLAAAIIEERERNGPFRGPEDLTRVNGIGSKTAERIRQWLETGAP